jgi:O-antigen/teichoic acid export membrane protein
MQFIVRTAFIHTLGKSYLGINGLFSNILTMLSLTEFGVGSAILFKLYEPIAKEDHHRIAILMKFYKNVYRVIGLAIAALGLLIIPFLPVLIKDYDKLEALNLNAVFIFLLYLMKTVSSYLFFAYKSAIIKANQKEYYINLISYVFTILAGIVQIIFLFVIPKFEVYVTILILQVVGQNIVVARLANKLYPYINEATADRIEKREIKEVIKDCSALFLYKLNGVVGKTIDNIVLSTFIGLDIVGMYSNYYIFYTTIHSLFSKIFGAVSHSLGNLHTTKDVEHEYSIFEVVMLISAILGGTAFIGIFVVADEFVLRWIGVDWVLPQPFSFLMGLELYTMAVRTALGKYRSTMGLFRQGKFRPVAGMVINLVVSILLVNVWGICGVLVGTIATDWLTFMWYDPIIIHKYGFKNYQSVFRYFKKFILYFGTTIVMGTADYFFCSYVLAGYGWLSIIFHSVIVGLTVPASLILVSYRTTEGEYLRKLLGKGVRRIKKKLKRRK